MRKAFTTETQRHRGKPKKIGRREVRSCAVVPGVVHSGGGGDREHREHGDHVCVASVGSVPQCLCAKKIGRREVRSGAVVPGVVHSGGRGDREHREPGDHVCAPSVYSVPQCLCEPGCNVESVPASEYEFSKGSTKPEPTQTTSPITLCSLSPPPPLCTTPTTKAQNPASRRPIFLGFPLCLCASVVNIAFCPRERSAHAR